LHEEYAGNVLRKLPEVRLQAGNSRKKEARNHIMNKSGELSRAPSPRNVLTVECLELKGRAKFKGCAKKSGKREILVRSGGVVTDHSTQKKPGRKFPEDLPESRQKTYRGEDPFQMQTYPGYWLKQKMNGSDAATAESKPALMRPRR